MLNIFRKAAENKVTVTQTLSTDVASYMDEKIWRDVVNKLADLWVEKYGADLLKEITPKQMKVAVRKQLEDKVAERLLKL